MSNVTGAETGYLLVYQLAKTSWALLTLLLHYRESISILCSIV